MEELSIDQYSLHHLDVPTETVTSVSLEKDHKDLESYVIDLVGEILTLKRGRFFEFSSNTEEVPARILKMGKDDEWTNHADVVAQKLIREEVDRQKKVEGIADIRKGSLLQVHAQHKSGSLLLFIKIDHEKIVDANALAIRSGLPVKKDRVQKSCLARFSPTEELEDVIVSDSNSVISEYWWKNFLSCKETQSSSTNTKNSYINIDNLLKRKIKKKYPADYHYLKNDLNSYFANNDGFVFQEVVDLFNNYKPENKDLVGAMPEIVKTLENLPEEKNFDRQFDLDTSGIKSKIRHNVVLAENFELRLNGDVPNLDDIIDTGSDDKGKYIKIYSEAGYREFYKKAEESEK
ncbi:hypothetical protein FMN52_08375 [Marinobacter sp. BW6]|uniref:nucleoid-associated protein n=1 Tax=Marinobacter sp. BW6 TaxID=2592624 RepID=UPI0011DE8C3D|nr:nucleoid-associated protein [Marinobacter sp. BW6]TYC59502.1 hypothetical protein FMN52_08375 [Marinobacter sp. BW6]